MLLPLTSTQRTARFGSFRFEHAPKPGNPEAIRILDGWAEANIALVHCPQLARLFGIEGVRLNRKAVELFFDLWQAWDEEGLVNERVITSWDGSFVTRFKRQNGTLEQRLAKCATLGASALSNHGLGTAFDICAANYPLGVAVPKNAPIRALVPAAKRIGWFPGMEFVSRVDGMHWEFCGVAPATDEQAAASQLLHERLTRAEIRAAQAVLGLNADGVIGPKTLARARAVLGS